MEFKVKREYFQKALMSVGKAVSKKSLMPILTGVKIEATSDRIMLTGSNGEFMMKFSITHEENNYEVLEVGSVVAPSQYLLEVVKKLPGDIHIKTDKNHKMTIISDEVVTRLSGLHGEDYPKLPEIEAIEALVITSHDIKELIKQTRFAASTNHSQPVLTGVHWLFESSLLTAIATNSQRLSMKTIMIQESINGSYIVPSTSLNEMLPLIDLEAKVELYLSDQFIVLVVGQIEFYTRLLTGHYPDIKKIIPTESKTEIIVNRDQFLKGIERANLLAAQWKNHNVTLVIVGDGQVEISSAPSEMGEIKEKQRVVEVSGEKELSITFDGKFMEEALKVHVEKQIRMGFDGNLKPIILKGMEDTSCIQLISPVLSN
ncbi:DNA polymerase III subunit beta [Rossellomorea aquimaris]|uniref:DNA polymerase III subunit beta n=1 Tax=Rossellomorea aquimaris TaxID=189382 RepID=UPI0007D088A6|nr:DNA polymerase III subunit beta [Rossellomorea aquimaris]